MKIKLAVIFGVLIVGLSLGITYGGIFSSNDKYEKKEIKSRVSVSLQLVEVTVNTVKLKLSLDTHSASLQSLDLKKIITLKTDLGEIHPVKVPDLSSHHGNGTIVFKLKKPLKTIIVFVRDVPNIEERIFKWDI